jgi:hypothetical protein
LVRFRCDRICCGWCRCELDVEFGRRVVAGGQDICDVEIILAELVVGRGYIFSAEGDVGEGVEAVEQEVCVGGVGRPSAYYINDVPER